MKPDDFSDQIRRKLESVEPEFREKDWTRMQQALGHSTPVFAIGTKAGLMAAASMAAVMAFGGVAYQQYHANKQLHEQVRSLHQTVKTLQQSAGVAQAQVKPTSSVPPDTVYLTRDVVLYVAVPVERKRNDEIAETNSPSNPNATETPSTVNNRPSAGITSTGGHLLANPNGSIGSSESRQTSTQNRNTAGIDSPVGSTPNRSVNELSGNNKASGISSGNGNRIVGNSRGNNKGVAGGNSRNGNGTAGINGVNNTDLTGQNGNVVAGTTETNNTGPVSENTATNSNNAVQLALLSGRPFMRDTTYYQEGMARTARRMRRLLSTPSPSGAALAKVEVNRNEPNWLARIGPGSNVGWRQLGVGVFSEFRLNSHWRVGVGLTSMKLEGGSYLTEVDYGKRTKQNFRNNFAPAVDPRHDIINITPKGSSWQVPIMMSYRFGLGSGWSLVPSIGVNLSLSNQEEIGFAYLRGPGQIQQVTLIKKLPQQMLHVGSAAVYLEKNWGDWSLQLGPYASTPLSSVQGRLNTNTAGAAARLYYQFDRKKKR